MKNNPSCNVRQRTSYNDRLIYNDDKYLKSYIDRINSCIEKMTSINGRALYEPIFSPKPGMPRPSWGNSNLAAQWILERCLGLQGIHPQGAIVPYWNYNYPAGWTRPRVY
jgi:hypothetical protein